LKARASSRPLRPELFLDDAHEESRRCPAFFLGIKHQQASMTDLYILPGLDGTTRMLHDFIAAARPSFAAVEGIAYPADVALGYRELETFARAALPRDAPFVLIGESFSGPVAISIAANPPPNVEYLKERNVARSPGRA
jgi:hypothetical protein